MTIKNTMLQGTDFIGGDVPSHTDWNDTFNATDKVARTETFYGGDSIKIVCFTDSIWQTASKRTTDAGSTWGGAGFQSGYRIATVDDYSSAAGSFAVALDYNAINAEYTNDFGATWNGATTDPPNATELHDVSFPVIGSAVCVGTAGAGQGAWYTINGGDDWTQTAVGPTAEAVCVDMKDAFSGLAITKDGSVWYTTDFAKNWTDSTFNYGEAADAGYLKMYGNGWNYVSLGGRKTNGNTAVQNGIYRGDITANGTQWSGIRSSGQDAGGSLNNLSTQIIKFSDGTLVFWKQDVERSRDDGGSWRTQLGKYDLYYSFTSGATWWWQPMPMTNTAGNGKIADPTSDSSNLLANIPGTNKIIYPMGQGTLCRSKIAKY